MKTLIIVLIGLAVGSLASGAQGDEAAITKLDLVTLDFELPSAIRLRVDLAKF